MIRKFRVLAALTTGCGLVLGGCFTSQQLIEFGRSEAVLGLSSVLGQLITTLLQSQTTG